MAVILWPNDVQLISTVICVACRQEVLLTEATAGQHDNQERQAFACNVHFWDGSRLIGGWTDFVLEQQKTKLSNQEVG
jgi:hypothetical protein